MDKVKDFLKPDIIEISSSSSVFEACKRMKEYGVGSILITERKAYVGIFTETDLLKKVVAQNSFAANTVVSKVMTSEIIYIDCEASMVSAFLKMQTKNVRHLVVKKDENVAGIISIKDVAKFYVDKFGDT